MKRRLQKGAILLCAAAAFAAAACRDRIDGDAHISFVLSGDYSFIYAETLAEKLRSGNPDLVLPDTNDFILSISDQDGNSVYYGPYGERPEPVRVTPGSYDVAVFSREFSEPQFSAPQFGDSRTVVAGSGQTVSVAFGCTQLNCGLRLIFTDSFRDRFFTSVISAGSDGGSLPYPYTEKRTGYFFPGIVRIICTEDGKETPILSRQLEAADMLTIKLSASDEAADSFTIDIDTSRNWMHEDFTIGSGNDGSSMEQALAVADLALHSGAEDVWVAGYIAGGDVTTAGMKSEPPFTKNSHLAIADRPGTTSREQCAAVELPSSGEIREAVNLVDHPEYLGRKLYVKGDIENYFGSPGVKNIKEFRLE